MSTTTKTGAYEHGYEMGRDHARSEIVDALKRMAANRQREISRLERLIEDRCEHGSLMGYHYEGRITGIEQSLGGLEYALERLGLDLDLEL